MLNSLDLLFRQLERIFPCGTVFLSSQTNLCRYTCDLNMGIIGSCTKLERIFLILSDIPILKLDSRAALC